jgi:uncharacterized protein involved in exopolysaccharide biosynthesis
MNQLDDQPSQDLSLILVLRFLRRNIVLIALCVGICAAGAVALAFIMTPMYRAEVVMAPANHAGSGELGNQLGGLASLAGINIGGANQKADQSLEYLRSRVFTRGFIERHDLMPVLYAKQWDPARGRWRDLQDAPTIEQGVTKFSKKVREVTEDRRTGIITVAIIWSDRFVAAQWANWLVAEADKALRDRAIAEESRSVEYLKTEAEKTSTVVVEGAISNLMETELKNSMVARTRDSYAFEVIDPAVTRDPKDRDSPNKPLILSLGLCLGFLVGVLIASIREYTRHAR